MNRDDKTRMNDANPQTGGYPRSLFVVELFKDNKRVRFWACYQPDIDVVTKEANRLAWDMWNGTAKIIVKCQIKRIVHG